jgi:hypothetical protein
MKFEGIEIAQFQIPSSFQISSSISIPSNFIFFKSSAEERATSSNYRLTQQIKNIDDSLTISGYIRSPRAIEADRRYTGKDINGINLTWQHSSIKNVKLKKNDFNLELRAFRICIQYLEYSRHLQFSSELILLV